MTSRSVGAALTAAAVVLLTSAPAARADGPAVNVQRFDPSPHAGDLLSVRTAEQVEGRWWSFGLFATHARRPLTIRDETPGQETQYDLVLDRTDLEVMGAVALWGRLSVGLALPIVAVDRGDSGFPGVPAASGGGIGDLKLAPKVLILPRRTRGFGLGFETVLTFPTATARYAGDGWSGTPRVIVDGRIGDTTIAFNTGMRFREGVRLGLFETSHEFLAALGARQGFWKDRVQLLAELGAATQVNDFFSRNGTSLEGQLGADICVADAVRIYVAAGKGFVSGLGDSQFRVTAGARMEPCGPSAHPIPVEVAAAPAPAEPAPPVPVPVPVPEPKPEPAAEAEPAPVAAAPVPVPEPKPEPAPAPAPEPQGPPPASPRAAALPPPRPAGGESDGRAGGGPAPKPAPRPLPPPPPTPVPPVGKGQCPAGREAGPLGDDAVVFFDFDRAEIRPEFRPLLDRVAQTLKADRSFKVGVSGHADETGSEEYNAALSRRRAQGVVQYLVSRGVQRSRLSIEAYGEACPAAGNESDEGRQRNRRVEFRTGVAR